MEGELGKANQYAEENFGSHGRVRHGSPTFYALLQEMAETHDKKSHDYASDSNPSGNYHFAGEMAVMFSHSPQDAGFVGRLAEKLYRIKNLESSGRLGITESIEDTERDIATITALWIADRRDRRNRMRQAQEKVRAQMAAGEWSGLYPDKEVRKDEEVKKEEFFAQVLKLVNEFNSTELNQLADYCRRLGSDKAFQESRLNPTDSRKTESPSQTKRV